jgi:AcrR family transcriptional regulator
MVVSTDDRILDAAEELFAAHGFGGTTTRALAQRAGVNEVTLFRRFGSKAGVLQAVGERVAGQTAGLTSVEVPRDLDLRVALERLASAEVAAARRFGALTLRLAMESAGQAEVAAALGEGTGRNRAAVAGFLAARQARGELRGDVPAALLAESFFALTSGLVLGRLLSGAEEAPDAGIARGDDDGEGLVAALVVLFLAGARAGQPGPDPADAMVVVPRRTR